MIALIEYLLGALLIAGTCFIVLGAFGLVKLGEFFKRLHAPTKASTLGVGCVLLASVGYHLLLGEDAQPRELLITAFLFITAPISAHLMSKAALALYLQRRPRLPPGHEAREGGMPPPDLREKLEGARERD
jgi:multicomponent K+:H+ antiporter subunit G